MFGSPNLALEAQVTHRVFGIEAERRNPLARAAEWANAVNQGTVVGDFWGSRGIGPGELAGSSHVAGS